MGYGAMKRHILISIQGAGLFVFDHVQENQDWDQVFGTLDHLKVAKETHPRVLSSSRKLLKGLQLAGQAVPSEIKPISLWELKLIWFYRGLYLELLVCLDKRKVPLDGNLVQSGKALTQASI